MWPKGSSGIWCEELLKSAEVVTNWTSSVNVSYPRMTADLLESQGNMYRTKTGVFYCWLPAIAGWLATLNSNACMMLARKSPARPPMRKMAQRGVWWGVFVFGWAQRGMQRRGVVNTWGHQCWVATGQHSAWLINFRRFALTQSFAQKYWGSIEPIRQVRQPRVAPWNSWRSWQPDLLSTV